MKATSETERGRGPTRLISPVRTLMNCGNSSSDVRRKQAADLRDPRVVVELPIAFEYSSREVPRLASSKAFEVLFGVRDHGPELEAAELAPVESRRGVVRRRPIRRRGRRAGSGSGRGEPGGSRPNRPRRHPARAWRRAAGFGSTGPRRGPSKRDPGSRFVSWSSKLSEAAKAVSIVGSKRLSYSVAPQRRASCNSPGWSLGAVSRPSRQASGLTELLSCRSEAQRR